MQGGHSIFIQVAFIPVLSLLWFDRLWQNQPYYTDNHFWVKVTIANYNFWTGAPANLKFLACIDSQRHNQKYTQINHT